MKLVFVTEARFVKDKEGNVYGSSSFNLNLWHRYLEAFSEIRVVARVDFDPDYQGNKDDLASSSQVSFIELPHYIGPLDYLKKRKEINQVINSNVNEPDSVYICRIPGNIGSLVIRRMRKIGRPFGVEVVGDPWDVFAPGSIKHPLRPFFRVKGYLSLKKSVAAAQAVLYVTKEALQKRYPSKTGAFTTFASDVKISKNIIALSEKKYAKKEAYSIISIGSLDQMYKGPDTLINAIKILKLHGLLCTLTWLGDGKFMQSMKDLADSLDVQDQVFFKGNVNSEEVRENLKNSDLFVLASKTEGLPRAIIEAMAMGLPCIGTNVGGIPELLEQDVLVEKNNAEKLALKISSILQDESFYNKQSKRNLEETQQYLQENLDKKRVEFYEYLKNNATR